MARTPEEVFQHHAVALGAGNLDEIIADYTDDAVFITPAGIRPGKDGIREAFAELLADVPNAGLAAEDPDLRERRALPGVGRDFGCHQGRGRHRHVHLP
jgi:ketosteroid isomerase-like protein